MTVQADLDKLMDEASNEVMSGLTAYSDEAIDRVERTRLEVYDILDEYSKKNGIISESRIRSLLRELDDIEQDIYSELEDEIKASLYKTVEQANKNSKGALVALLGVALVFGGRAKAPKNKQVVDDTVNFVMTRKASDGLTLTDRLRAYASLLIGNIQASIRYGIRRKETVNRLYNRVRGAYKSSAWMIKRLVTTELPLAYRKTILYVGGKSGIIRAVKIIDHRGRHPYHEHHECYRLAEQDKYGWGKGVYRVEDTFILDPHPQCSAYYRYILDTDKLTEGEES